MAATATAAAAATASNSCKVVLASAIAKTLLVEVTTGIRALPRPPRLHGFLANGDPAAEMYAKWTKKTCEEK
jgi:methylenetetrahydrofolate dehydrogenase (NAD+)